MIAEAQSGPRAPRLASPWDPAVATYPNHASANLTAQDAGGSVTSFLYDNENRLTTLQHAGGGISSYTYAGGFPVQGEGLRRSHHAPGGNLTTTIWDGSDYLMEKGGGATVRYLVSEGEMLAEKRSGLRLAFVPDPLGSVIGLLNSRQAFTDSFACWPYGEERVHTGSTPTPLRWIGYYEDMDWLYYTKAEWSGILMRMGIGSRGPRPATGTLDEPDARRQTLNRVTVRDGVIIDVSPLTQEAFVPSLMAQAVKTVRQLQRHPRDWVGVDLGEGPPWYVGTLHGFPPSPFGSTREIIGRGGRLKGGTGALYMMRDFDQDLCLVMTADTDRARQFALGWLAGSCADSIGPLGTLDPQLLSASIEKTRSLIPAVLTYGRLPKSASNFRDCLAYTYALGNPAVPMSRELL